MSANGLVYFDIYLNGKEVSGDKVYDKVSSKRLDEIVAAIKKHLVKHVPQITFTQVVLINYRCFVDFVADNHNSIDPFSLPDLSFALGKQEFLIEFDDFYPTDGGARSKTRRNKRSKRSKRRLTRRRT